MNLKMNGVRPLLLCSIMLACSSAFAVQSPGIVYTSQAIGNNYMDVSHPFYEVLADASVSKVNVDKVKLGVTSSETDTLVPNNTENWDSWGGRLGMGYNHPFQRSQSGAVQWFPSIEPEINVYHSTYKNKGDVYRFNDAAFNDLTYDMPIHSTRLMFDVALTVAVWKRLAFFALAGVGNAWNTVSYSDKTKDNDPCPEQRVSLSSHDNSNLAWEGGVGMKFAVNHRVNLSFEYLYADLGTVKTATSGNTGSITTPILTAANFHLHTQALLFGVTVAV